MSHLTTETLIAIVEDLSVSGSWSHAARVAGMKSTSTLYEWLSKSKAAQKLNDDGSPFRFQWRDRDAFLHEHAKRARAEQILGLESLVREQCGSSGVEEICYDPSTNRPLPALDPQYLGVSDEVMLDQFLDPVRDRWLWRTNERGERIEPYWQTKITTMPASLRAKVLTGVLPQVFGERAQLDVAHSGQVVHIVEPAAYVRRADREVVDASFREIAPPRQSYDQLKERERLLDAAERHLARPDRVTRPDGPVLDANGQPLSPSGHTQPSSAPRPLREDQAERPTRPQEMARETSPDLVQPAPAPRPYRRDSASDAAVAAHRTSSQGGNLKNSFR